MMNKLYFLTAAILCLFSASANIRLPSVISNNMVLQQQSQVQLWGWSEPGEIIYITTSWNGKTDSVKATPNAKWKLYISTPAAGGPFTITLKGQNSIVLDNILIGEVWVCSGQSNMEMNGNWGLKDIKAELPAAYNPQIRFFHIPRTTSEHPQDDCAGEWKICDSNSLKSFSAAGYFFGKRLQQSLNVPIGLIEAAWGGTPAEVWTPDSVINANPVLQQAATNIPPSNGWPVTPGFTYNAMIAPLVPYHIAGVIWYQGESNTAMPTTYKTLFTSMIRAWRRQWNKNFPFYFVQIAPFTYGTPYAGSLVQEAQFKSLELPNTGMAVITDLVDDTSDIHPTNKQDVGLRLANLALGNTYGHTGAVYKSPLYNSMEVKDGKMVIAFHNTDEGLMIKGRQLSEIVIAGPDKIFYPATAAIKEGKLVVWSKQVKEPAAVRYAFRNAAIGNLYDKNGLPASPFRTDDWALDNNK